MSNTLEKYEQDEQWLAVRRPLATEYEIDKFCESVAKRMQINGMTEELARAQAIGEL
ncbi:MAG: hypothetical protein M0R47_16535 [Methylobacter sp.]|uniref:hypothetical protein n=1 Tax=Methylobacter sp. TaxID=2051955 RepID=UPI0025EF91D5|nr:hypothetical protein [Methylobacter sp.]MCK9622129.1 hypothetical protein [Methylobacter sp.]